MKAFGGGKPTEMTAAEALDVAKAAKPGAPGRCQRSQRPEGRPEDQRHAGRYRQGPGRRARWSASRADRISIVRSDARVGDVVVHFPARRLHRGALVTDLILHHFATSPFSEKVRIAFGIKQLAWKSVDDPEHDAKARPDAADRRLSPDSGAAGRRRHLLRHASSSCSSSRSARRSRRCCRPAKPARRGRLPSGSTAPSSGPAVGMVMGAMGDKLPAAFREGSQRLLRALVRRRAR